MNATGALAGFTSGLAFELDPFQVQACEALQAGHGVLVAAPTGAGKTVVGEFAVHLALASRRKAFYTTPIKALSNQKYTELVARHGADRVGLLTGDNTINGEAPVVVMTTEVLRNMLYAGSATLAGLGYVVMDEVHYLADRFRGAVWEEVIIHLPGDVQVVSLSATVSNAEEFGAWLGEVRGDTAVIVSESRPVPLWQHVMAGTRLYDLFVDEAGAAVEGDVGTAVPAGRARVNPELVRMAAEAARRERLQRGVRYQPPRRGARGGGPRRDGVPSRAEVTERLGASALLPAITFIFSRAGCDAAVRQCLAWGVRLTDAPERQRIRDVVEARCADIPDDDLGVLGYWEWLEGLERGVAAHHAGLLPTFKEVVEELFAAGLVKMVFATETLALGVNMPARSVVLERLVKWNGEIHADVTPGEYTQLTGRAGRRGIDVEGHAVVLWSPGLDPEAVGGLASTRTYPLRSSFRPTYNMAANLVAQVGRARAREILQSSFAQFQADRAVVHLARQARSQQEALAGYAEAMACDLGDFREYAALRRELSDLEGELGKRAGARRRDQVLQSLEALRPGDVVRVPSGRRPGAAVVLDPGVGGGQEGPRPTVLTEDRRVRRLALTDLPGPVRPLARLRVPASFNPRNAAARRDLAARLRDAVPHGESRARADGGGGPRREPGEDERVAALRRQLRGHPCHACPDREEHARWAERWWRLKRETDALVRRIDTRTNTVAATFDRVCDLLVDLEYLQRSENGDVQVTGDGEVLRRLYSEADLLVAECLRDGVWAGLDAAGLAACVSVLVYESRREEQGAPPRLPGGGVADAVEQTVRRWSVLEDAERAHGLQVTRAPDVGLVWAVHRWARGQRLDAVLREADLAAGDFVRWCKQLVDLLDQIAQASGGRSEELRRTAHQAVDAVRRGVVAYSSVG